MSGYGLVVETGHCYVKDSSSNTARYIVLVYKLVKFNGIDPGWQVRVELSSTPWGTSKEASPGESEEKPIMKRNG